ncbi:MAG: CARDB domain-containing protein [Pseudomonadota bacterium]|nr:CARDB domain-containing protein [Pseudomonadota bacterium]
MTRTVRALAWMVPLGLAAQGCSEPCKSGYGRDSEQNCVLLEGSDTGTPVVVGVNLVPSAPSPLATDVTAGGTLTLSGAIGNEGPGTVEAFSVGAYLSTDNVRSADDTALATWWQAPISAGASDVYGEDLPVPAGIEGSLYVVVVVDPDNLVAESNELDNEAAAAITVTADCAPRATYQCVEGDVFYYDSCGVLEEIKEDCDPSESCVDDTSSTASCHAECTPDAVSQCHEEDAWYYDSCGNLQEIKEDCGATETCVDDSATAASCHAECTAHASYQCSGGDVYYLDSCGAREEIREDCGSTETCVDDSSSTAECQAGCTSHDAYQCYAGDVYYYDSCGTVESLREDCGATETCVDDSAATASCQIACTAHDAYQCSGGDVYYYDSCGEIEEIKESCSSDEACVATSSSTAACESVCESHDTYQCNGGDVYYYDSCGDIEELKESCSSDEACVTTSSSTAACETVCESHDTYQCNSGDVYYYDSCGDIEEIKESCSSDEECVTTSSSTAACESVCESHDVYQCYSGDVYYYDSCGSVEERLDNCASDEVCVETSSSAATCGDCEPADTESDSCDPGMYCPSGTSERTCSSSAAWGSWSDCEAGSTDKSYYGDGGTHCGSTICLSLSGTGGNTSLSASLTKADGTAFSNDVDLVVVNGSIRLNYGCVATDDVRSYTFSITTSSLTTLDLGETTQMYAEIESPCTAGVTYESDDGGVSQCKP